MRQITFLGRVKEVLADGRAKVLVNSTNIHGWPDDSPSEKLIEGTKDLVVSKVFYFYNAQLDEATRRVTAPEATLVSRTTLSKEEVKKILDLDTYPGTSNNEDAS